MATRRKDNGYVRGSHRGRGTNEAQQIEIDELCVDLRRGGMSYRQIARQVSATIRERLRQRHLADIPKAAAENRDPIPEHPEWSITHEACRLAVQRALRRAEERTTEVAKEIRQIELERLDTMQMALWPKALGDPMKNKTADTQACLAILKIMEHRRVLTGIGAAELGALGEEGAEVRFSVWTPEAIAKKKADLAKQQRAPAPAPAPAEPTDAAKAIAKLMSPPESGT
jgi:hypothetical protein